MPDHVHLLVDCTPQHYIPDMLKTLKGNTARFLFKEFPGLKKKLWGGHLWNPSYVVASVGENTRIDREQHRIKLPKVGWVAYAPDGREIPGDIVNVTVSRTSTGKYFASILCQVAIEPLPAKPGAVGIDLGLKKFAILSDEEVIDNPKYYVKAQKTLARLQRAHSNKKKGSKNREKARSKVARQHEKVANQRRDFLHKLSRRLVV